MTCVYLDLLAVGPCSEKLQRPSMAQQSCGLSDPFCKIPRARVGSRIFPAIPGHLDDLGRKTLRYNGVVTYSSL